MDRALRLAPADPNIALSLASVLLGRDPARAAALFGRVATRNGPREAWQGLAAAKLLLGQPEPAAQALSQALSTAVIGPGTDALADAIVQRCARSGWCGIRPGDGDALVVRAQRRVVLRLDGKPVEGTALPSGWTTAAALEVVTEDGQHLLGSPINLARLHRLTGFVEAVDGGLRGWAWYPANPDALPRLLIQAVSGNEGFSITASDSSIVIADAGSLARPRGFAIPAERLTVQPGGWHVRSTEGRDLLGSPLDPWAMRDATRAIAGLLARLHPVPARDQRDSPRPRTLTPPQGTNEHAGITPSRSHSVSQFPPAEALEGQFIDPGLSHAPMPIGLPPPPPLDALERRPVDVVIPVHDNASVVLACLDSVLRTLPSDTTAIVVDDASTDPALRAALDELAAAGRIRLIRHARNLGFPHSANAGLAAARGDVVLLNSDTLVPRNWLSRLQQAVYAVPGIGTATPLSNEATIVSYPTAGGGNLAPDQRQTERLAAVAWRTHGKRSVEIPVGVGFCLYIRRDCLDAVGMLRTDVFAQGYGEENDFCLRARALGWRNVAVPGVFVTHRGGGSFDAAGRHLLRRNQHLLNQLHPGYDALIEAFAHHDPMAGMRRDLDLARWRSARSGSAHEQPETVLLITHADGGGVEQRVRHACRAHLAAGRRPVVLRPARHDDGGMLVTLSNDAGQPEDDLRAALPATDHMATDHVHRSPAPATRPALALNALPFENHFPNLRFRLPDELPELLRLLRAEPLSVVEVHHVLDHHPVIHDLPAILRVPHEVHVHDYTWFCPRVALVDADHRYCGEPPPAGCEACCARGGRYILDDIPVADLIDRSARFLQAARRVYVPSHDAARRMSRHFPGLRPTVIPHEVDPVPTRPSQARTKPPTGQAAAASTHARRTTASEGPQPPGGRSDPARSPNVRNPARHSDQPPRGNFGLTLDRQRERICVAGAIGLHKGYNVLLACAQDAARRDLDIEFVVVGTTTDDAALLATQRVFITGRYTPGEAVSLIQAQNPRLGLLPSIWPETWCLTLSELWRAGLDVVSFDVGAQAERIKRSGRGHVVPLGLPAEEINNALVAAICRVRDTKVC